MDGNWGKCGILALLFGLVVGCRTPQPNLKPVETPETLHTPPQEARYNNPGMPKEAFTRDDASQRLRELDSSPVQPAAGRGGSFGGPSAGMMR